MKQYLYIIMCLALVACGGQKNNEEEEATEEIGMTDVTLTDAQAKSLNTTVGVLPTHVFSGLIEANGTLAVMPQSEAMVSPYLGANVKAILVKEGQTVRKGQALATLSHPDLVELQSRYLAAYSRLSYVQQEYERQKQLYSEKIGSVKDYQQIQSEYRTLNAELSTTASQLKMLGINIANLRTGKTVTSIAVTAPISGTIEDIMVSTGQYADSQTPMFRIVNTDNIYADLLVFEKDVPKVKVGQKVRLELKSATGDAYQGTVYSVGKTFESNPKAVHVRVNINGSHEGLITGMYLCGKIASESRSLTAIPSEGVVEEDGKAYIFTATKKAGKWLYHPMEITKGREEGEFTEIVLPDGISCKSDFLLDNAYYILSEMKKAETGEE